MTYRISLPSYRLFPYERTLAERELAAVCATIIERQEGHYVVDTRDPDALRRLTYFSEIRSSEGAKFITDVASMEASHRAVRGRGDTRQATRYHLHGLHEYKGKFNPQVVRAFANLLGFQEGDWIVDPFCGSGTALLEGLALGGNSFGIDLSPIAVLISRAKVEAWKFGRPQQLAGVLESWLESAGPKIRAAQRRGSASEQFLRGYDSTTREYLRSWFPADSLAALVVALRTADELDFNAARLLARVAISSIARSVSLQLPQDLRIRRRPDGFESPAVSDLLRERIDETILSLHELRRLEARPRGTATVVAGSAGHRTAYRVLRDRTRRATVITSPPYATALPYIDTDRLSVVLLGFAVAGDLRSLEESLYGSREWNRREHAVWRQAMDANRDRLPEPVLETCRHIDVDTPEGAGFRRCAVAPLLYRYFTNMAESMRSTCAALDQGELAVYIVGENRTNGATGRIVIDTPTLLAEVGASVGFAPQEIIALDTWPRFGLHQNNGISAESAIVFSA